MRDMIKPTFVLFVICLIVGAAMAFTNIATAGVIKQRIIEDSENSRKIVLPEAEKFIKLQADTIKSKSKNDYSSIKEAYSAKKGGKTIGYVFLSNPKGYAGEINVMIGINEKGSVSGIQIGDNRETPGLGSKANNSEFKGQYLNKKFSIVNVVKRKVRKIDEIEAISGATITSKAVSKGVEQSSNMADELLNNKLGVIENELVEGS